MAKIEEISSSKLAATLRRAGEVDLMKCLMERGWVVVSRLALLVYYSNNQTHDAAHRNSNLLLDLTYGDGQSAHYSFDRTLERRKFFVSPYVYSPCRSNIE